MNPCPCGFDGDRQRACRCTPDQVERYRRRISGPLLDRIDLLLRLNRAPLGQLLSSAGDEECSEVVRRRVSLARETALSRQGCSNARLGGKALGEHSETNSADRRYLERAAEKLGLSMRSCHRVLRVARTIADMATEEVIGRPHLDEALAYRQLAL